MGYQLANMTTKPPVLHITITVPKINTTRKKTDSCETKTALLHKIWYVYPEKNPHTLLVWKVYTLRSHVI